MTAVDSSPPVPFAGVRGALLSRLLQLKFVRFHRVQLGFVEHPLQYRRFLADVVVARVDEHPGRVCVFGAGEHTRVLLEAAPDLLARVHCLSDNNPRAWGQERFGLNVLPPEQALHECQVVLLSTAVFQHVIRAELRRRGFRGPIVAVDDVVPPAWFLAA